MKQSVTVGAQLWWCGRYGCNNGRYGCTIVMPYIEINKAVSQWLLTFNLCVSVTWPLTCAFHIPCTHTPEITDMHRGVCDNMNERLPWMRHVTITLHDCTWWCNPSDWNSRSDTMLIILNKGHQGTELWGVYRGDLGRKLTRYNGTVLYNGRYVRFHV